MLNKLKIRYRVLIIFLSVALTGSFLQLIIAGLQLREATLDFHHQQLEISALSLASSLSEPFEEYIEYNDRSDIRSLVNQFIDTHTSEFVVLSRDLTPMFSSSDNIIPDTIPTPDDQLITTQTARDGVERLYITTPVIYENQVLGYVMTTEPSQNTVDDLNQRLADLVLATFAVAVLVILGSIWLAHTISTPIQSLERGALNMAEGYLDTRIEVRSNDEIGQLASSFNYMAEEIDNLIKVQQSFVSNAAHELRTPLMSLRLRVEALQGNNLDADEKSNYLKDLSNELQHMTELVTSLLNLARIDERRMLKEEPVEDISASLKDIARHWRIAARKSSLTFETSIPNQLSQVEISQNYLRLICDNLLGNAVKYTPNGIIHFRAEESNNQLILIVQDTGIGFTAEQSEKLFDRFYRTDVARANYQGTGLGLSIIEALLEDYKGHITATSNGKNQGATFTVTLPIRNS